MHDFFDVVLCSRFYSRLALVLKSQLQESFSVSSVSCTSHTPT